MEEELEFWTKGQGQVRERAQTAVENEFDEEGAVKELENRMTKLEVQMSDLLSTIKDGFETIVATTFIMQHAISKVFLVDSALSQQWLSIAK